MPANVVIPADRLNKILDAVSVLALCGVDIARTQILVHDDDDLALLEHSLNDLGAELVALRAQRQQAQETIEAQRLALNEIARPFVELINRLGLEVVQKPAGERRTELELIVDKLVSAGPARSAGPGAAT